MELVEHRRGVQRLDDHQDRRQSEDNASSRLTRDAGGVKDHDNDEDRLSDCDSDTSEVLSVGSEPTMPSTADGLDGPDQDDPRSVEHYESDVGTSIANRGLDASTREPDRVTATDRSTRAASSPSSRSPSPSPSSSGSCNPPQSPASNYCVTPPEHQHPSPSSPAALSVRSPASSSATASSPGRPDAHQEAIVPRYQSSSSSSSLLHQNLLQHHQHHQPHLLSGRYAAAAIVSTARDTTLGDYPVVSASTIARIPAIIGHHAVGLTATGHGASTVADLIGYSQQSIDPSRMHRPPGAINVPLVTRLSLSPPTAMTVTGLQATTPGTAFHPVAVAAVAAAAAAAAGRDPRDANSLLAGHLQHPGHSVTAVQHPLLQQQAASQVQHVPASTTQVLHHHHHNHHQQQQPHHHSPHRRQNSSHASGGQHRLSVSKLLQQNSQDSPVARESSSPVSPRLDDQSHGHHQDGRTNSSPGNNGTQTSSAVSAAAANNNNSDRHRDNNNSSNSNNNNNIQHQGSLKFSIDNILKADFGRRITDPISLKKSRPKKVVPRPIDLTKDFLESSSEGSERGSETSTTNPSPGAPTTANAGANGSSAVSPGATTPSSATGGATGEPAKQMLWPAWVYCTRYSDRPSSGRSPRTRRVKRPSDTRGAGTTPEEKRPRTAFSGEQLARLKREFAENRYLTERRRQQLSRDLGLNEAQIKIWFQNKRAKIKKASGQKNPLALQLMAQGLYNHSTVPLTKEEEEQAAELQAK